jgi:hypothetical protein
MLESFMEDLLWEYPDEFWPGRGFKKERRQHSLSEAGRLDISFRDSHERLWVIEVKAVPVRIEIADQVHRYADKLRELNPHDRPIAAVVGPVIGASVRDSLNNWGVEWFEFSEAMFRRVANEKGISMEPIPELDADALKSSRRAQPAQHASLSYVFEAIDASYEGHAQGILVRTGEPGTVRGGLPYPVHYVADQRSLCGHDYSEPWPAATRLGVNVKPTSKLLTCKICIRLQPVGTTPFNGGGE